MPVYRLDPVDPGHFSWDYSVEKDTLWACADGEEAARELAATKSGFPAEAPPGAVSPWRDPKVTSCAPEPSMKYPAPGEVVREDGSHVHD